MMSYYQFSYWTTQLFCVHGGKTSRPHIINVGYNHCLLCGRKFL